MWPRVAVVVCVVWLLPGATLAQLPEPAGDPSDQALDAAREEFVQGMAHAQRERWRPALERFLASYALSGAPAALYNVASTYRRLQRPQQALEAVERLLADPDLDPAERERGETLRRQLSVQIATLIVHGLPPGEATVTADGSARPPSLERPLPIPLDPGLRIVTVRVPPAAEFHWSEEIAPGARVEVDAALLSEATAEAPSAAEPEPGLDPAPIAVGLGLGAAVIVAAVITAVVLDAEAQLGPRRGLVITLP